MSRTVFAVMNHLINPGFPHSLTGAEERCWLLRIPSGVMTRLSAAFHAGDAAQWRIPNRDLSGACLHRGVVSSQFI